MQELVSTAWALSVRICSSKPGLSSTSAASAPRVFQYLQQDLAGLAWAMAPRSILAYPLCASLSAASRPRLCPGRHSNLDPGGSSGLISFMQSIANISWSLATIAFYNLPGSNALASAAIRKIRLAEPQNLSNTAWAAAVLDYLNWPLLEAISAAARPRLSEFGPLSLSNLPWAVAVIPFADRTLCHAMAASSLRLLCSTIEFMMLQIANIAWSVAPRQFLHDPLRTAISSAARPRLSLQNCESQRIAMLSWACDGIGVVAQTMQSFPAASLAVPSNFMGGHVALMGGLANSLASWSSWSGAGTNEVDHAHPLALIRQRLGAPGVTLSVSGTLVLAKPVGSHF